MSHVNAATWDFADGWLFLSSISVAACWQIDVLKCLLYGELNIRLKIFMVMKAYSVVVCATTYVVI